MKLETIQSRIAHLHALLSNPQPELFTWVKFLHEEMNELCAEWHRESSGDFHEDR